MTNFYETYNPPQLHSFDILAEKGFAMSQGGSIDDLPLVDWSAPSPFNFSDDEPF